MRRQLAVLLAVLACDMLLQRTRRQRLLAATRSMRVRAPRVPTGFCRLRARAAAPPPRVVAPPLDQGRAEAGAGATHVGDGDKGRVLFLDGPPPALEGGAGPEDGAGALKRRKRRKKKKKGTELVVAGVEDADNESE